MTLELGRHAIILIIISIPSHLILSFQAFGKLPFLQIVSTVRPTFLFTARCYAFAVLAMALCPSVCLSVRLSVRPSVRPSQVGVLLKRLNVGSHKQHYTIAQGL